MVLLHPATHQFEAGQGAYMDQTFLLLLCVCVGVGFISGYGVRALISEYRRRQALEAREVRRFFRRQARRDRE